MTEMVYKPRKELEILAEGEYEKFKYVIISQGLYPMAYIENKFEFNTLTFAQDYASPHGSFTYLGKAYWNDNDKSNYLGWYYGHKYDFNGYDLVFEADKQNKTAKKWTTQEIIDEIKIVINEMITNKEN